MSGVRVGDAAPDFTLPDQRGRPVRLHELTCASTDANVPIALGIPAIALGAGGHAGDAHLPTEWYENIDGPLGVVRALLVTAAMAEVR